ncbi:oxidoreductase [Aureococcus anophagefferens]|nr:oxidoreductase [Aureococcus anophagefferens]
MMRALSALTLTSRAMSARALAPELTRTALAPTVTLASGYEMPVVALGTWKAPAGQTGAAVEAAIKAGYRNIDAANDYNNEPEVGAAIKKCIAEGVACPAGGLQASTRVDGADARHYSENPMFPMDDDGAARGASFFLPSKAIPLLPRLLLLRRGQPLHGDVAAMEALVAAGKCRSIGLSNFNKAQLEEVVAMAKVPVSILQNECHPYLQQKDLVDVCRTHGVAFQAFSPLGSGDTNLAVGPSPTGTTPLKDPVVNAIADRAGKDAGQVILKHAIARGIAVVTKSVTKARVESNFELFDWDLSPEDTKLMDGLNCGWRHLHWRETSHHPDYSFRDELPFGYELEKVSNFAPGQ